MSDGKRRRLPETIAMVWPYLAQDRLRLLGAIGCLFASVVMRMIEPWPLQYVLDHVLVAQLSQASHAEVGDAGFLLTLTICAILLVLIAGLRGIVEYTRTVSFARIGNRVVTDLRGDVFRHLQSLSLSFHTKARSGDLTVRLVSDLNMIRDVAITAMLPLVASGITLLGMIAVMLWIHWKLGLLAIAVIPIFLLSATRTSRKIHAAAKQQRSREGALAATANESLSSVKVVQALSLERYFSNKFGSQSEKSMKEGVKTSRLSAALEQKVDVLIAIASALILWQGSRYVLADQMTIGGLVVYLAYLKRGFKPLQDFAKYTGRLSKASAAADRISEILHETPAVSDRQHATPAPALLGRIEFADVSFEYTEGCRILNDISFAIEPGRRIAVVGESGAGKSTLLALICRLHDPGSGCIRIDGTDIREWKVESLRAQLNIVMQDNAVFATTARENISLLWNDAPNDAIIQAAKLSGAHDFILRLPDGYDTQLGERGTTLSRGQIQRIAIARAALQSAPILLFDEPTSGLDEANERMVGDAILRASQGRTTLIVTHQLSLASRADQILVLKDGHIVESGSHDRLLSNDGVYAAMYQNQSSQWSANSNKRMLIGS